MTTRRTLGRRQFLKTATQVAATVAVCNNLIPGTARAGMPEQAAETIPARTFGKTGLELPILGFGGGALPKIWANPLSTEDRVKLVR